MSGTAAAATGTAFAAFTAAASSQGAFMLPVKHQAAVTKYQKQNNVICHMNILLSSIRCRLTLPGPMPPAVSLIVQRDKTRRADLVSSYIVSL